MPFKSRRQQRKVMSMLRRGQSPGRKTPSSRPTISEVVIEVLPDSDPDTSYLGEYSNDWVEGAIDREEQGDWSRGEFRYFIPSGLRGNTPEDNLADYKRMEALNRGDFSMVGIRAVTKLLIPQPGGGFRIQEVSSGGLWGIESDSGQKYFDEVAKEELSSLKHDLKALNIPEKAIDAAIKKAEFKEE